jgi:hypothetical protein
MKVPLSKPTVAKCVRVIVAILIALAASEVLGQIFFGNPYNFFEHRYIYTTPDTFRNVERFWTYKPHTRIDEIGIYRTSLGTFQQEYECRYEADGSGFLDNPGPRRKYDAILLGNSFTAGQAGCSWAQKLRDRIPNYTVYNAGLPGTGIPNWAEMLGFLGKQGYAFDNSVLAFIADDFFRPLWQRDMTELNCLRDVAQCVDQTYYPLDRGADIFELSARRAAARSAPDILANNIKYFWKRTFWVSYFILSRIVAPSSDSSNFFVSDEAADALDRIISLSKTIRLVRITTRDEVALGSDNFSSVAVRKYLADRNIQYTTCRLRLDEFFVYDAHPNARGYERIAECVADVMRGADR